MKQRDSRINLNLYRREVEKYGIKETKEALRAALAIYDTIKAAKADDGVIDGKDTPKMLGVAMPLLEGIKGADKIPTEWSDFSDAEILELKEEFGSVINNPNFKKIFHGILLVADGVSDEMRREEAL